MLLLLACAVSVGIVCEFLNNCKHKFRERLQFFYISVHTIEHHKKGKKIMKRNEKSSLLDIKKGKIFLF